MNGHELKRGMTVELAGYTHGLPLSYSEGFCSHLDVSYAGDASAQDRWPGQSRIVSSMLIFHNTALAFQRVMLF